MVDFFLLFELVETGMNTLQRSQQNLRHHPNSVSTLPNVTTSHFEMTVASWSAFDRIGYLQLSQDVSLKIVLYKFFYQSSGRKSFTFSQVF